MLELYLLGQNTLLVGFYLVACAETWGQPARCGVLSVGVSFPGREYWREVVGQIPGHRPNGFNSGSIGQLAGLLKVQCQNRSRNFHSTKENIISVVHFRDFKLCPQNFEKTETY